MEYFVLFLILLGSIYIYLTRITVSGLINKHNSDVLAKEKELSEAINLNNCTLQNIKNFYITKLYELSLSKIKLKGYFENLLETDHYMNEETFLFIKEQINIIHNDLKESGFMNLAIKNDKKGTILEHLYKERNTEYFKN